MSGSNVVGLVDRAARLWPDRVAVRDVDTGETVTYAELLERVARTAQGLRGSGLAPGDRVAFLLTNSPAYVEHFLAALGAGLVVVPLNTRLTLDDFRHMLTDSGARVLVTEPGFAHAATALSHLVERVVDVEAPRLGHDETAVDATWAPRSIDDLATLMYTSGTTGAPKAVMLSHGAWRAVADTTRDLLDLSDVPTVLHAAPLTHGAGFMVLPTLAAGGVNLTVQSYDPAATADLLASGEVDGLFLVPSMIRMLLDTVPTTWRPHRDFRWLYYAGSPITVETFVDATRAFDGRLVQSFAQMEAPMYLTALTGDDHRVALDPDLRGIALTAGRVLPGRRVEIAAVDGSRLPLGEVGEILARSPQQMLGYWNRPEATAAAIKDGWLHTGDLGFLDADGLLHVVDRVKDMIVTGGSNVYAKEVEDVVIEAAGVDQVAVIGLPHRTWGEEVTAVVVAREGETIDGDAVRAFCRERLAGYKVPKRVVQVDDLPRNPYGKVLKRTLKSQLAEGAHA